MLLDVGPAGGLRQVEDILHGVELMSGPALTLRATLTGCPCHSAPFNHVEVLLLPVRDQLGPAFLKLVGDELEEDQREDDVLVLMSAPALTLRATLVGCLCRSAPVRRLDGAAQLGGGLPERFLEGFGGWFFCGSLAQDELIYQEPLHDRRQMMRRCSQGGIERPLVMAPGILPSGLRGWRSEAAGAPRLLLLLPEDGEVFVDRFSGGVAEGSGVGINDGADLDRAEILESLGGELVFLVEVGGDDEEAVFVESFEGLVEDFTPDRFVIPVVLVTEEGDVGRAHFGELAELVTPVGDEVGAHVFAKLLFPA